jgi:hypothetical protein
MITSALFALATATCVWAGPTLSPSSDIPRRALSLSSRYEGTSYTNWFPTINGPTGSAGQKFQESVDNGASWQNNARNMPLDGQSTVGYRLKNNPQSSFIAKNTLASDSHVWLTYNSHNFDYVFGLYDNDAWIFTDFSKKPTQPITAGEWVPIPMSGDVMLDNSGQCAVGLYNATVFYKDGSTPRIVHSGHGQDERIKFHIDDVYNVDNITLSFGPTITPGSAPVLVAKYDSAEKAPLVTANLHVFGGFCDVDD